MLFKSFLWIIILLNCRSICTGQNNSYTVDPQTNRVSGMNARYNFSIVGIYDFDLESWEKPIQAPTIVVIKIDNQGLGQLISYVKTKNIFEITSCYKYADRFEFNLKNIKGNEIKARLLIKDVYVKSFWLDNPQNNTSIVAYNNTP